MPNRDGTGPEGKGPMTGRGKGNCKNISGTEDGTRDITEPVRPKGKGYRFGRRRENWKRTNWN